MSDAAVFEFNSFEVDYSTDNFSFQYSISFSDGKSQYFTEQIKVVNEASNYDKTHLNLVLQNLHLMLGISYYKLYCPKEIKINNFYLTKKQAEFWNTVYSKGLGEFFYKNKIDFRGLVKFPFVSSQPPRLRRNEVTGKPRGLNKQVLVPFGGGKDSIVTARMLKDKKISYSTFTLNPQPLQLEIIKKLGVRNISVQRSLDPKLFELNKTDNVYNGHIPITAVYSFLALLIAQLYDFSEIVMSNEKSANYGNVLYLGTTINHQWSKSEEFEKKFQNYINEFTTLRVIYRSLLRPFYEIKIAKRFADMREFHLLFASCNSNFKITDSGQDRMTDTPKWCGRCTKCAFVFILMAAFLPQIEVIAIFGKNLLNDSSLIDTYRQLLGWGAIKPFECVGTPEEVKVALYRAYKGREFNDTVVMKMFITESKSNLDVIEKMEISLLR